uniref:VWFA domain-containing protein n=1 Tax=Terrapene triunguis TaxID=2587831 RepID=A0A674IYZ9_9SAUR
MYINSYCFLLDQSLRQRQRIPDTLAECPRRATDIALLIDGSGSIIPENFRKMKTFISEIMKRFRSTDTQFALMQYSNRFREHFDFFQYRRRSNPDDLVRAVVQLRGWTHTATAIQKVVRELFTSGRGARDEATKILIVITDGEKYKDPLSYSDAIPEAERAGIIRYAIGVGEDFSSAAAQRELQEIASEPSDEHVFRVDNFDALQGIQSQLQEKIFAIEGTQSQSGSSFQLEMSQEGFSSLLSPDGPVLGAVGAYDWSGGIYLYGSGREPSFINVSRTSTDMNDAYLGYSSQVVTVNGQSSYMVGAPRYQHTGKVVLFRTQWKKEEKVGSYFGGTLCAVDLDRDGNTDLVLIGAPTYYTPLNGGRVCICSHRRTLQGQTGQAFGRFGASMSEIGDISGDGRTDVAIGAPMENDNRGALYIFHGEKGAAPFPSLTPLSAPQRIEGSLFPSRLHYFGQAISGGTDLTRDGLPDIAVGAQGQVLLLRSRPVLRVGVSISFQPPTIPTSAFNCQGQEQLNTEASRANVCFTVTKSTMDSLGIRISSTIQYSLALDPGRRKIRAAFDATGPVLIRELRLGIEKRCETYRITLPLCPEDSLTPITLRLNYTLTGEPIAAAGRLRPILSEDSTVMTAGSVRLPGPGNACSDAGALPGGSSPLSLPLSLSTLVVGVTPELNTTVSIQNRGENSYSTTVQFFYPAALSYRRVLQGAHQGALCCRDSAVSSEEQTQRNSTCHINHPIFWSGAEATFIATFDVSPKADLGDSLQITAQTSSDNGGPITERMIHRAELPVKYGIFIILTSEAETPGLKDFVKQMSERPLLVSTGWWGSHQPLPLCTNTDTPAHPLPHPEISFHPQDCSVTTCKKIRCRIASLEMQQPLEFMIKGNVSFQWVSQVQSLGQGLDPFPHCPSSWGWGLWPSQLGGCGERVPHPIPLTHNVSLSVWLSPSLPSVSYQLNFFKRQYKEMIEDARDGVGARLGQNDSANVCLNPDIPKQ